MNVSVLYTNSVCVGVEDISPGLVLPESADGGGWFVVGTSPAYTTHTDCLHFHLSVPVEHSTGVPLFGRREQRGERRYVGTSVPRNEHRYASQCQLSQGHH